MKTISKEENLQVSSPARGYPSRLVVEVTTGCNLACPMCVKQNAGNGVIEGNLSAETFAALEPAFPHLEALILSGIGEPLLHPSLEDFIRRARNEMPDEAWVGFQTNGTLLNEDRARSVLDAGLGRICISMDAASRERFMRIREGGDLHDVERAFSFLNRARKTAGNDVTVGIEFVLMRENLDELPRTLRWAGQQGASFAIVTQLLPYGRDQVRHAAYDTNTHGAIAVYSDWKNKALEEGVDITKYFDSFMKYFKNGEEEKIFGFIEQMKTDGLSRDVALHLERLIMRDETWFGSVERVFEEARTIAGEFGMTLTLPEMAPRNNRKCEFVETGSAFVSWDGNVHPCYFLWHGYGCYVGGWEKRVKPWVFGSLSDNDIISIWNSPDYVSFRNSVLRYDFPFCFDCSFALCDYVQGEDFEQDCYISSVPCGACLWCTGLFHCLQ